MNKSDITSGFNTSLCFLLWYFILQPTALLWRNVYYTLKVNLISAT